MSQHHHDWRVVCYLLLGLPTTQNLAERLVEWRCACGAYVAVSGEFRPGLPLGHPAQWAAAFAAEQRQGTAAAVEARRQQYRRIV